MKITIKILKKMPSGQKACKRARKWFKKNWPESNYPDGIDFWTVWEACQRLDWQVWFTQHSGMLLDEFCWKCAGQTFRYAAMLAAELAIYADNVTPENWQEARAAADAAANTAAANTAAAAAAANAALTANYAAANANAAAYGGDTYAYVAACSAAAYANTAAANTAAATAAANAAFAANYAAAAYAEQRQWLTDLWVARLAADDDTAADD